MAKTVLQYWFEERGHVGTRCCHNCGLSLEGFRSYGSVCPGPLFATAGDVLGGLLPDEAKVAATAQKLRVESVPPGPYIPPHWSYPSKPATPEPLEWGDIKVVSVPVTPKESAIGFAGRMVGAGGTVTIVNADDFFAKPPEPSPLNRALEDFTARRKAKRTNAEAQAEAAGFMTEPKAKEIAEAQAKAVARAISTPLPHDPPMSARLMPYRSKEP